MNNCDDDDDDCYCYYDILTGSIIMNVLLFRMMLWQVVVITVLCRGNFFLVAFVTEN